MIRHIVAWNFAEHYSNEQNREHAAKIKEELEGLRDLIPGLVDIQVITEPAPSSNRAIVLNTLFETEDALAAYQENPHHVKASKYIASVTRDRVCLDLEA